LRKAAGAARVPHGGVTVGARTKEGQVSLRDHPLLYVFLEAHDLAVQCEFLESVAGLSLLESDDDPKHRHGVVKYAAGPLIISVNLAPPSRFAPPGVDGMTFLFAGGTAERVDQYGHRYLLGPPGSAVTGLRLTADDPDVSAAFYRDVLGLPEIEPRHTLATGNVPLVLTRGDGRPVRHDTYLLVFHTTDIERTSADLAGRGVTFAGRGTSDKDIGRTMRFADPSGHRLCLYEPSGEALARSAGAAIRTIVARSA
jgi:catechol 2,3-dioxygenase-like lactoylglutathione lyase family enzyme